MDEPVPREDPEEDGRDQLLPRELLWFEEGRVVEGLVVEGREDTRLRSGPCTPQELCPELLVERALVRVVDSFEGSRARQSVMGCWEAGGTSLPIWSLLDLLVIKRPPPPLLLMADEAQMGVRCATTMGVPLP